MAFRFELTNRIRVVPAMFFLVLVSLIDPQYSAAIEDQAPDQPSATFRIPGMRQQWVRDGNPAGGELSWREAQEFVKRKNSEKFAGIQEWRLPSRDELKALAQYLNRGGSDTVGVTAISDFYWSATTGDFETDYADAVNMADGSVDNQNKSDFNYVWPVSSR